MKLRLMSTAVLVALLGALALAPFGAVAAPKKGNFLKNVPVNGQLSDGRTFTGTVTITHFSYAQSGTNPGLTVSGVLNGTASDGIVYQNVDFTDVRASLTSASAGAAAAGFQLQGTCQILDLDIGAIHLDLLGLVVDLSPIHLDITAVSGAGNLLGNLLCAVAGLLDPGGVLTGLLTNLLNLLDRINQIIG